MKRTKMYEVICKCTICRKLIKVKFVIPPNDEEKEGWWCDKCAEKVE